MISEGELRKMLKHAKIHKVSFMPEDREFWNKRIIKLEELLKEESTHASL